MSELPALEFERTEKPDTLGFRWPAPPYLGQAADIERNEPEACRLTLRDGIVLSGKMSSFLPLQASLEYLVQTSRNPIALSFDRLKTLQLIRPLVVKDHAGPLSEATPGVQAPPEKLPYTIQFVTEEALTGETLGYIREPFGLFLFQPGRAPNEIQRLFIPSSAITNFSIGGLLGKFLVEEKLVSEQQVSEALDKQREIREQRIGDYLVQHSVVTAEDLLRALQRQESAPLLRLGEALIQQGLLTEEQLQDALEQQRQQRTKPLGKILVEMGFLTFEALQLALARKLGFPLVQLDRFPLDENAIRTVPYSVAARLNLVPILISGDRLVVALEDPWRTSALDEIKFMTQMKVVPVMTPEGTIEKAVRRCYFERRVETMEFNTPLGSASKQSAESTPAPAIDYKDVNEIASELSDDSVVDIVNERQVKDSDNALVRLVNTMILDAYQQGVSDIHVETYPGRQTTRVRFRKDGILAPYLELPAGYRRAIVSRIKVMADLDISEHRKAQDGKINFARFAPAKIELRVATIPTTNGLEDVVMRILMSAKPVPMEQLALSEENLTRTKAIMNRSFGLFLICGPTGSGKTTTLHSCLSYINVPERKIWTAEDPVEITQPGLRQVQVQPKIDWTFAAAMRSFLRADPDVIMVGEMRDAETVKIGIEASLTGHLVLSTLHTNGSAESVTRLLDMGADPFNFSDSLLGILAQRLARRLCMACRRTHLASNDEVQELLADYCHNMPELDVFSPDRVLSDWRRRFADKAGKLALHHSPGCEACGGSGYKGRVGIHELLVSSREIRRVIQRGSNETVEEIQRHALAQGTRTLRQDGIEKVLQGLTDLKEIHAVSN